VTKYKEDVVDIFKKL